jgi:hypothetical protein
MIFTPESMKEVKDKARERYGEIYKSAQVKELASNLLRDEDKEPSRAMNLFIRAAFGNLMKDKTLMPVSFSFPEKGGPEIFSHQFRNQEEKLISFNVFAERILKLKAQHALVIVEAFVGKLDYTKPISVGQGVRECLNIYYASAKTGRAITIEFTRDENGEINFQEPTIEDFTPEENHSSFILIPIFEALKKVVK